MYVIEDKNDDDVLVHDQFPFSPVIVGSVADNHARTICHAHTHTTSSHALVCQTHGNTVFAESHI